MLLKEPSEAPRGGAGIEIWPPAPTRRTRSKPLVEGLVLKYSLDHPVLHILEKPLVEGLVLKLPVGADCGCRMGSPSWRGWY